MNDDDVQPLAAEQLTAWRQTVGSSLLRVVFWIGPIAVASSAIWSYLSGDWIGFAAVTGLYAGMLALMFWRRNDPSIRTGPAVWLCYISGTLQLLKNAPSGAGFQLLLVTAVLAGLLLDRKAARLWCAVIIATVFGITGAYGLGLIPSPAAVGVTWWLAWSTSFAVLALVAFLAQEYIVESLLRSLEDSRRHREELAAGEARFRTIFNAVNDAIFIHDIDTGRVLDVNDTACRMSGYTRQQLLDLNIDRINLAGPPYGQQEARQWMAKAAAGTPQIFDWLVPDSQGHLHWLEMNIRRGTIGEHDRLVVTIRNIDQRKRAEEAFRQKAEEVDRVFNLSLDLLCVASTDGRFVRLNPAWQHVLGYPLEELEGKPFLDFVHPDDIDATRRAVAQLSAGKDVIDFTNRYRCRDGSYRWIEWRSKPYEGNLIYAAARDVTERKQAQEALRQSQAGLQALIDAAPYGAYEYQLQPDNALVFVGFNQAANRIQGVDHTPLLGKTIEQAFPPLAETTIPNAFRSVAATGVRFDDEHLVYQHGNIAGTYEVSAFQTGPNRMAVLFRDVTERKRAETALRQSEARIKSIFQAAPVGIGMVVNRTLTQANDRLCQMTGYACKELCGQSSRILYPTQEDFEYVGREKYKQITEKGTGTVETRWKHKNGTIIDVLLSSTPLDPDDWLAGVTFTALDITQRKQMEAETRAEEQRLQALLRISQHQPATMQSLLDLALEEIVQLSASQYGYIFHYSEDIRAFTVHAWSKAVMRDCAVHGPSHVYPLDSTGIWGEAVRQRRPIVINDFAAANPLKKGHPEGHVTLSRFMTIPIFSDGHIVAVAGVANKPEDYTDADVHRLTLMMDAVWRTIERKQAEQDLQQINAELEQRVQERTAVAEHRADQLRELAGRLTTAEHRERRRVAHILHEHFQQLLASAKFSTTALRRKTSDPRLEPLLQQIEEVVDESIRTSRSLSVELCPPVLYDMGLASALEWLGRWVHEKYGLTVSVQADPQANPRTEDTAIFLFHATRELLFNTVKHAHVDHATVHMSRLDDMDLQIVVADKGTGFDPSAPHSGKDLAGGFGLFSIRERIELMRGSMDVLSAPGQGARISLKAPITQ